MNETILRSPQAGEDVNVKNYNNIIGSSYCFASFQTLVLIKKSLLLKRLEMCLLINLIYMITAQNS